MNTAVDESMDINKAEQVCKPVGYWLSVREGALSANLIKVKDKERKLIRGFLGSFPTLQNRAYANQAEWSEGVNLWH